MNSSPEASDRCKLPMLEKMLDMASQQNLAEFVITQPNHICCNGFNDACCLNDYNCISDPVSPAICLNDDTGTQMAFKACSPIICPGLQSTGQFPHERDNGNV